MAITRDAKDVWEEVRQKADKWRESNTPIYTLAENVPNQIIKVESDRGPRGLMPNSTQCVNYQLSVDFGGCYQVAHLNIFIRAVCLRQVARSKNYRWNMGLIHEE